MAEKHLTAFLIGFSLMFFAHYMLEPTWKPGEPRPNSTRAIFNYSVGTLGICISFLYLHMDLWLDLLVSVAGAGSATILAHSRDWLLKLIQRDQANGLVEDSKDQA
jgi:hypothetical protein